MEKKRAEHDKRGPSPFNWCLGIKWGVSCVIKDVGGAFVYIGPLRGLFSGLVTC